MGGFTGYRCSLCAAEYRPGEVTYTCPKDGGNLDVVLDYDAIRRSSSPEKIASSREHSVWRYGPLLPVGDPGHEGSALHAVGWTPLLKPARLAEKAGLKHLWLKDDGRNPTASFKDRASAIVVVRAQEIGAETIVTASTGNAGAALAGMAAAAGRPAVILAPKSAPPAKVAQLLIFGARVILVDGTYDQAFDLTLEAAREFGWYCRNTGFNPFTVEGKKTAAFEIAEQYTASTRSGTARTWVVPDAVFVSVGDGNIISGIHKFRTCCARWIRHAAVVRHSITARPRSTTRLRRVWRPSRPFAPRPWPTASVDLPRDGGAGSRRPRQRGLPRSDG
jgi:threonine synthase